MPGRPIEEHEYSGSFGDWLRSKGIEFDVADIQPIEVSIDGKVIPATEWDETEVDGREVKVVSLPHGGVLNSVMKLVKFLDPVLNWFMKSMTPKTNTPQQQSGAKLETIEARANEAKFGMVVPELLGRFRRYPEYLVPPRRYYEDPRTQVVTFLACVGPGHYAVENDEVKIGDTPFSSLGDDGYFAIYPPGADVSAEGGANHWHTVTEVGGTSSGTAGLELSTEFANRGNSNPASYSFDWDDVSRSSGEWPAGWGAGTTINVEYPRPYEVTTITVPPTEFDAGYEISEITGWFHHFPNTMLAEDAEIGLGPFGAIQNYRIRSISPGSPTGVYTIRLEDQSGAPVVLTEGAAVTLRFGSNLGRSITTMASGVLTVTPGRFETVTVPGARIAYAGGTVYGEWTNEFVAVPGSEMTDRLEFDVFFPGGLAHMDDDGDLEPLSVGIEFEYRDIDVGGARTTVTRTYTQSTLDQIGFTESVSIPMMRPSCRMRRVGSESTDVSDSNKVQWYGLKSRILTTRFVYPNWTTIAVSLRSGGKIAAQSENQINLVATRLLPKLSPDNTWTAPQATRDISAAFHHILASIGYTDDQIDMDELQRLHGVWTARGETFDHVFDETTIKQALDTVLRAGMSELSVSNGLIKPVRDEPRTTFESGQGYSPQNMTGPLRRRFKSPKPGEGDPDGVEVEYTDEVTWTKKTIRCGLPGDAFLKADKLKIDGVTNGVIAWRIGMRRRRMLRYRNWEYSFSTEMDALNSEYLSYVPLLDDIPGYGKSAILERIEASGSQALLYLSEPMEWEEGATHMVAYRRLDGTVAGPFAASPGPDECTVLADIPQPWPVVNLKAEPPHVYFGTAERWCFPALITEIRPNGNESVSVTAVNYADEVYADDDNLPPT